MVNPSPSAAPSRQSADRQRVAADFRQACPVAATMAAEVREFFGAEVRLTFAAENGVEVGKQDREPGIKVSDMVIDKYVAGKGGK